MRNSKLDKIIKDVIRRKLKALDIVYDEMIKPLRVMDNPEDLIGKPYGTWTPEDLTVLAGIYGKKEPNTLSRFIFNKEYELVKSLESEEV